MRVLVVENDSATLKNLLGFFISQTLLVDVANTGEDALELLGHYEYDIVVLSLSLPDMEGARVISRMRQAGVTVPVLGLSPQRQPRLSGAAFAAGADDVFDQRVDRTELVARMHAIVRRSMGYCQSTLSLGPITLHLDRHEVTANGVLVHLTGKEYETLQLLITRRNDILTKEVILAQLYGGMGEREAKIVDVFICKIRKKLARAGVDNVVGTVWGRGYTIRDLPDGNDASELPRAAEPAHYARTSLALA
jgi:two-component system cell cycle response regulator CtrA